MADQPPSSEAAPSATAAAPLEKRRQMLRVRSMEDELRPLPAGWIRQLDYETDHQFFVDARANPPRSTWDHPWDDGRYLTSIPKKERKAIGEQNLRDIVSTDAVAEKHDDGDGRADKEAAAAGKSTGCSSWADVSRNRASRPRHCAPGTPRAKPSSSRHTWLPAAPPCMLLRTGEPQFLRKDRDGKDVFIVPPAGIEQRKPVPFGAHGCNPYDSGDPNARFLRPRKKCKRSTYRHGTPPVTYIPIVDAVAIM